MLYEIIGTDVAQGADTSGSENYLLTVRGTTGAVEDLDGISDVVTWMIVEGDGTDLTANINSQSRLSTGKYKVTVDWAAPVVKPFYWTVTASFTHYGASITQDFVTTFLPIAEADLTLVEGTTNYGRGWKATLADVWAAVRGTTSGSALEQDHLHADESTAAFTVTVSADGDRTYS